MENNEQLKKSLLAEGFSSKEIQDVIEGLEDIKNGKTYTAEEVHKYLFNKEPIHA